MMAVSCTHGHRGYQDLITHAGQANARRTLPVVPIIAPPIGTTNGFPNYARILSVTDWRSDITAVARRQVDWELGYRDADLLACPIFFRTPSHGIVLLYGSPVLLVMGDSGHL